MVEINFRKIGNVKDTIGIGRKAEAIEILGMEFRSNGHIYRPEPGTVHFFLSGLEKGKVHYEILDKMLPNHIHVFTKSIKFVVGNTNYIDSFGNPVSAGLSLEDLRSCGRDFKYQDVLYALSEEPKLKNN